MAARTAAPADPETAPAPHAPPQLRPNSPVLAWPSEWPVPQPPAASRRNRGRAGRGLPMAPALAAAGNATTITATAAYEAAGVVGLAATGVVAVAGTVAAVARRRRTVQRNMSQRGLHRPGGGGGGSGASRMQRSGGGLLSPSGRQQSGGLSPAKSGGAGSAYRPGGGSSGLFGPGSGGGKTRPNHTSPKSHGDKTGRHKNDTSLFGGSKGAGLKAAANRAARNTTKPGSLPRKTLAAAGHGAAGIAKGSYRAAKATGRGVKKAWTAERAQRIRDRARKLRGAGADGLRATLAATWAGLRKRSARAALNRLRDVWARRRKKRADNAAAHTDGDPEPIADSVRRPTTTQTDASPTGDPIVPGHHFTAPAMEMARIAAAYEPTGMLQVGEDFSGLEEALRLTAEAMKVTVDNADVKFPLAPQIIETMRQIFQMQIKAAELAAELRPAFESLHHVDLERLRNPRKGATGEAMWDVRSNL